MGVELASIFYRYGAKYRKQFGDRMPPHHRQAMRAIEQCRTEILGGHIYLCQECNEVRYSYHSCRNRHCPKCQNEKAQQWLEKQQEFLLPVTYFLLTFTLPAEIKAVARSNQPAIYDLLFRTSAAATQSLASDPRFVGGQIGMIGVLHTWGRNLSYHPHVHYLVPAGGFDPDSNTWLPACKNFLVPVKALSKLFRAKFREALRKHICSDDVPASVWKQDWVVHCQLVGNGERALKYLAPYIFRVAISNNRILKLAEGKVTFFYKDTNTGKTRLCTLIAEEFIRRFLQHVLPKGFVKIRYYGFFSAGCRKKLAVLRQHFGDPKAEAFSSQQIAENDSKPNPSKTEPDYTIPCPICGQAMKRFQCIQPKKRDPP